MTAGRPEDILPLTPSQELMLAHSLAAAGDDALITQVVFALAPGTDEGRLERAWREVVAGHTQLRASFEWQELARPVEVVHADASLEWTVTDWRDRPADEAMRLREQWLAADRRRAFDLRRAPLARVALLRLTAHRLELVWTAHHLVVDRWCTAVVQRDVEAWYDALGSGSVPSLPPPGRWRDYLQWLQRRRPDDDVAFWRTQLAGVSRGTIHTSDRASADLGTAAVDLRWTVPAARLAPLKAWARRCGVTTGSLVLGLWSLALARASGRYAFFAGLTVSGRPPEIRRIDDTVGCFTATLPLRIDLRAPARLDAWLQDLQERVLGLQAHACLSPVDLRACSELPADEPLFDTLLLFQGSERATGGGGSLRWQAVDGALATTLPLVLAASERDDGLTVHVRHRDGADLAAFVERWRAALDWLVVQGAASPDTWVHPVVDTPAASAPPAPRALRPPAGGPPRSALEARLLALWTRGLGRTDIGVDEEFFALGGTSLQALALMTAVQQQFGRTVPFAALFEAPTIRRMAERIDGRAAARGWAHLVPVRPTGDERPLFLVHHGGGGSFGYAVLAAHLDARVPLYAFHEPGFEPGEVRLGSIAALAARYVDELRTVQPAGPYRLGGFCFGGLVAFEMAQQLSRAGEPVECLVLIDAASSHLCVPMTRAERRAQHGAALAQRRPAGRLAYVASRIARRVRVECSNRAVEAREALTRAIYRACRATGLPEPAYARQIDLLHHNGRLAADYRPSPYCGRVLLVRSDRSDLPADFGWDRVVAPPVSVCQMPTEDHLRMLTEPHVARLAAAVNHVLREPPAAAAQPAATSTVVTSS